jgi:sugar O-acyltransferase (sialic acid O-acetyltransferase NeuD family)
VADVRYVLWGSAGHAKVLASLIALRGARVIATFDNSPAATALSGVPLYVGEDGFARWVGGASLIGNIYGLAAIGGTRGRDRLAIQALFARHGLRLEPLVHPGASVCSSAQLGAGTQILAQAVVASDALLGAACIVNHKASVDHECRLGDGVHIAPGATLCGLVAVGDGAFVGAGAVVLPRLSIGADAVVGAGAVVTRDVPAGVVVAGNPAHIHLRGTP